MIKLLELLEKSSKNKKAIIFAGPVAAGKTTIIKQYVPVDFQKYVLNSDNHFEKIMGTKMDQDKFSPEELSNTAKAMQSSIKQIRLDLSNSIKQGVPIIIDATGGSIRKTVEKKEALEGAGYDVMMVMIYTSPLATLKRNSERDRKLKSFIVLQNWKSVVSNIKEYMSIFGKNNFVVVNADRDDDIKSFSADEADKYFRSNIKYKQLSPEAEQELESGINRLIQDCEKLPFLAFDELDTRIKNFLIPIDDADIEQQQ